ncbi:MAG TPA: hypothetical protein PK948_04150 [Gemmatimonadales bacterium]|nr:hypothetical protein [Gemmatimonadales bacterium]
MRLHPSAPAALFTVAVACSASSAPAPTSAPLPVLTAQTINTRQLLQAVSVVNANVVWVSGHGGTWARSEDGGTTWTSGVVPGGDSLQFRDVYAADAKRAWLMSAGNGAASRIYHSEDGGKNWTQQFRNGNSKAFYDCMSFWDDKHGIALSDGVNEIFPLLLTKNGKDWALLSEVASPHSRSGEGSFAASGTCIATRNGRYAWFGTGAAAEGHARVFRTTDAGRTWSWSDTPITTSASAGLATVAFRDLLHGVAAGGNIAKPDTFLVNVAVTSDGGATWAAGAIPPFPGPVYGAAYAMNGERPLLVAVGPRGAAVSWDDARSWALIDTLSYWSVGLDKEGRGWLVGPGGRVRRLDVPASK